MSPKLLAVAAAALAAAACSTTYEAPYAGGMQTVEYAPAMPGPIRGVGVEGHDIVQMADIMVRDMLLNPAIAAAVPQRRVIMDAEYFKNESAQRINAGIITDNLRVNLQKSAAGRIRFISRESMGMVAEERDFKRDGVTDPGTLIPAKAQLGADFRLIGRIASTDQIAVNQGLIQRYNQVTFEMVDLETSEIVWTGMYNFARAGADDVIYR
jgi:penicillin-binding protein activator